MVLTGLSEGKQHCITEYKKCAQSPLCFVGVSLLVGFVLINLLV